jgi:hypothetical protein
LGVEIPSILWKVPALTILSDLALREVVVAWRAVIGTNNPVSAGQLKQKAFDSGGDDLLRLSAPLPALLAGQKSTA